MDINYSNIIVKQEIIRIKKELTDLMPRKAILETLLKKILSSKQDNGYSVRADLSGCAPNLSSVQGVLIGFKTLFAKMLDYTDDNADLDDLRGLVPTNINSLAIAMTYHKSILDVKFDSEESDNSIQPLLDVFNTIEVLYELAALENVDVKSVSSEGWTNQESDKFNIALRAFVTFSLDNVALVLDVVDKLNEFLNKED